MGSGLTAAGILLAYQLSADEVLGLKSVRVKEDVQSRLTSTKRNGSSTPLDTLSSPVIRIAVTEGLPHSGDWRFG